MEIVKVSSKRPDPRIIKRVAQIIQRGGLIIFPTETVYGLGADAFNARAVAKIFRVKGRPEGKPLIVHVAKKSTLDVLAQEVPSIARKLVKKFWPGPLTIVLSARTGLPKLVTAKTSILSSMLVRDISVGGRTVAVRMPDHAVARALIMAAGPIAAPSANFSGAKPPTRISEIPRALMEQVDLVLDAGSTKVKVSSTVLDLTMQPPVVLRPGAISRAQLKRAGLVMNEQL